MSECDNEDCLYIGCSDNEGDTDVDLTMLDNLKIDSPKDAGDRMIVVDDTEEDDSGDEINDAKEVIAVAATTTTTTPQVVNDDADETSSDDDDDDNINVTINQDAIASSKMFEYLKPQVVVVPSHDYELNNEIDDLIKRSVILHTTKVITIFAQNTLILVPIDTPISARLASHVWPSHILYHDVYEFPHMKIYNENLPINCKTATAGKCVAFFTAVYTKIKTPINNVQLERLEDPLNRGNSTQRSTSLNTSGLYMYYDFTMMIVKNGQLVDCAIHGFRGKVDSLVEKYDPEVIYYDGVKDGPFDTFMHYKFQPFYHCMNGKLQRVDTNVNSFKFNTISFCQRGEVHCSFCKNLRFIVMFYSNDRLPPTFNSELPQCLQTIVYDAPCGPNDLRLKLNAKRRRPSAGFKCKRRRIKAISVGGNASSKSRTISLLPSRHPMSMKRTVGCNNDYTKRLKYDTFNFTRRITNQYTFKYTKAT